jgi:hypothetical protein
MLRAAVVVLTVLACGRVLGVAADEPAEVTTVTFRPPFKKFDSNGARVIDNYKFGGHTELNEYFVRLTPDRAVRAH